MLWNFFQLLSFLQLLSETAARECKNFISTGHPEALLSFHSGDSQKPAGAQPEQAALTEPAVSRRVDEVISRHPFPPQLSCKSLPLLAKYSRHCFSAFSVFTDISSSWQNVRIQPRFSGRSQSFGKKGSLKIKICLYLTTKKIKNKPNSFPNLKWELSECQVVSLHVLLIFLINSVGPVTKTSIFFSM